VPHLFTIIKHCLDFSIVFSAPLPIWRNLFSASGIFCGGRYQPGYTAIFCPAEGTSQPIIISTKWKNPSSAVPRKKSRVQALPWFWPVPSAYRPCAQISNRGRAWTHALLLYIRCPPHSETDFSFDKARKRGKERVSPRKTVMLHTLLFESGWVYLAQPWKCDVHRDKTKIMIIIHRLFVVVVHSPPDCSFLAASSNLTHRFEHCLAS
jgi:hypothetical protein